MAKSWTEREDQIIRDTYARKGKRACAKALAAEGFVRTTHAMAKRAGEIGATGTRGQDWTQDELDVIAEVYPNGGANAVMERLTELGYERSKAAISTRAHSLGIHRNDEDKWEKWDDVELYVLRTTFPTGGAKTTKRELAKLGYVRTEGAISGRAAMLGLKNANPKRRMTKGGDKVIRNICLDTKLDQDVIDRLDTVRNRSQYVRDLVKRDIG